MTYNSFSSQQSEILKLTARIERLEKENAQLKEERRRRERIRDIDSSMFIEIQRLAEENEQLRSKT